MEAATHDYRGQELTGNGMTAGAKREAANEPAPTLSDAVVYHANCIARMPLDGEEVVALLDAIREGVLKVNGHLGFNKRIAEELAQLADSINAVVNGEVEVL